MDWFAPTPPEVGRPPAAGLYNAIALPWGGVHVTLTPVSDDTTAIMSDNGGDETSSNGHRNFPSNGGGNGNGTGGGTGSD